MSPLWGGIALVCGVGLGSVLAAVEAGIAARLLGRRRSFFLDVSEVWRGILDLTARREQSSASSALICTVLALCLMPRPAAGCADLIVPAILLLASVFPAFSDGPDGLSARRDVLRLAVCLLPVALLVTADRAGETARGVLALSLLFAGPVFHAPKPSVAGALGAFGWSWLVAILASPLLPAGMTFGWVLASVCACAVARGVIASLPRPDGLRAAIVAWGLAALLLVVPGSEPSHAPSPPASGRAPA